MIATLNLIWAILCDYGPRATFAAFVAVFGFAPALLGAVWAIARDR